MDEMRSTQDRVQILITMDLKYLTDQFLRNEEMGEKRVALFVSLTAGLGAASLVARERLPSVLYPELFITITVMWLLFGYLTFLRIVQRNITTDNYKKQLRKLRKWFVEEGDQRGRSVIPYDPYGPPDKGRTGLTFRGSQGGRGGYAELVALINCGISGALAWQIAHVVLSFAPVSVNKGGRGVDVLVLAIAAASATLIWFWLSSQAARAYKNSDSS